MHAVVRGEGIHEYVRVRWLECEGEEEGRSNRDLIEWLPGKLVYSRFLLTTGRLLQMPRPLAASNVRMWGKSVERNVNVQSHCNDRATYMCSACSCYVRSMRLLTLSCTSYINWIAGMCQKIICMNTIKGKRLHQILIMYLAAQRTALTIWHRSSSWQSNSDFRFEGRVCGAKAETEWKAGRKCENFR